MDWKELGQAVAKIGLPLLGAVLPIPGGAAIGSALAAAIGAPSGQPQDILTALTSSAEAVQKAKEFEMRHEETMLRMQVDADIAEAQEVTKRQQYDMASDSWLAKNIRPMTLIAILAGYFIFAMMSAFDKAADPEYVKLLGSWGMLIMSFYFGGRTLEKIVDMRESKK